MATENVRPRTYRREEWGDGPWQTEPDRLEWKHQGFPCLMLRTEMGNWCGYVAVEKGHPYYEKNSGDLEVDVHGGLNYAAHCSGHICHVPAPGESDEVWWLGFDCAHCGDIVPSMVAHLRHLGAMWEPSRLFPESYKDVAYVRKEVNELADQLAAVAKT